MASQATVKRVNGELRTDIKRGRPKGSVNRTPEEKRLSPGPTAVDYLRTKNEFQKPKDFYAYLTGYPDKTGLMATVYRLIPIIDVTIIGLDETGILKTATESEMNEDHIGNVFGRGKYMLILNDGNRPSGQREVAKTWFDLTTHPKPPVYDPRSLVLTNAKNLDEINRLCNIGIMVRDRLTGQVRVKTEGDGSPVSSTAAAPAAPASPFGSLDLGHVVANLLTQGSRNPHDAVKDTIEMAKLLKPEQPPIDVESIIERVVARLGEKTPADPFAVYNRVGNFVETAVAKVLGPGGVAAAGAPNGRPSLAQSWGPYIPQIFSEVRALLPEIRATFADLKATQNGYQNGAQPMHQRTGFQQLPMEKRIEEVVTLGFQRMREGMRGFDFAAYVCGFHPGGLEVFRFLDPNGPAGLIGLISMTPQGREFVNDPQVRPQIDEFLKDFFEFDASHLPGAPGAAGPEGAAPAAG